MLRARKAQPLCLNRTPTSALHELESFVLITGLMFKHHTDSMGSIVALWFFGQFFISLALNNFEHFGGLRNGFLDRHFQCYGILHTQGHLATLLLSDAFELIFISLTDERCLLSLSLGRLGRKN